MREFMRPRTSQPLKSDGLLNALRPSLKRGEVFVTNARIRVTEEERNFYKRFLGTTALTAEEKAVQEQESGRYQSVRIVTPTFDSRGRILENYAAVVGIPKPQPPHPA